MDRRSFLKGLGAFGAALALTPDFAADFLDRPISHDEMARHIKTLYKTYLGREASDEEVAQWLVAPSRAEGVIANSPEAVSKRS